jgi:hypothetical protein
MRPMDYLYTLSGFAVGAIVGLTGVGGGSLMTPLLVLLFGVPSGHGGRHRPALRGDDQGRRHRRARPQGAYRLGDHRPPGARQHSGRRHHLWVLSQLPKGSNVIGAIISHGLGFALLLTAIAICSAASCATTPAAR